MTLEASVAVTVFIFLMLFLYSLFGIFETRNELAHVVMATADSLALDTYEIDKLENSGKLVDLFSMLFGTSSDENGGFTSGEVWNQIAAGAQTQTPTSDTSEQSKYVGWDKTIYVEGSTTGTTQGKTSSVLGEVIKERFVAYLADGDESKADELLKKRYHVTNGLNGISFAESCIKSGKIYIVITYKLDLEYTGLLIGRSEKGFIELQQSACSKLWS